ncbi:MAG: isoprenylcysteine carboxylmethyltransferase family protein [Methylophaga sp.]|nr:isoprenylcysteine carboxylmethyltransferase family protein [Methylophaga sp.]
MLKLKIPPPIYLLLATGIMWLLDHYLPIKELITAPWNNIGLVFVILGLSSDGMSLVQFFRAHTTMNPIHPENTDKLVTTGMYRFTRNPMYVGLVLLLLGWAIFLGSLLPFIMLPIFMVVMTKQQIIPEEHILEHKFGQQYRDYKLAVKRWL